MKLPYTIAIKYFNSQEKLPCPLGEAILFFLHQFGSVNLFLSNPL